MLSDVESQIHGCGARNTRIQNSSTSRANERAKFMTMQNSEILTIAAVRASVLELGLVPLGDDVVEKVIEYGLEAVIECTLAMDQPFATDANLRGVIYARAVERIGVSVALQYRENSFAQ